MQVFAITMQLLALWPPSCNKTWHRYHQRCLTDNALLAELGVCHVHPVCRTCLIARRYHRRIASQPIRGPDGSLVWIENSSPIGRTKVRSSRSGLHDRFPFSQVVGMLWQTPHSIPAPQTLPSPSRKTALSGSPLLMVVILSGAPERAVGESNGAESKSLP
jgi:hypothetical protein